MFPAGVPVIKAHTHTQFSQGALSRVYSSNCVTVYSLSPSRLLPANARATLLAKLLINPWRVYSKRRLHVHLIYTNPIGRSVFSTEEGGGGRQILRPSYIYCIKLFAVLTASSTESLLYSIVYISSHRWQITDCIKFNSLSEIICL